MGQVHSSRQINYCFLKRVAIGCSAFTSLKADNMRLCNLNSAPSLAQDRVLGCSKQLDLLLFSAILTFNKF